MGEIRSESKFVWRFVWMILITPWTAFLALIGKKEFGEVLLPFKEFVVFLFEPKFTISIILVNIAVFFLSLFMSDALFARFINHPSDLMNFRIHTLITAGFFHADMSHLLWNMLGIFVFGRIVERRIGTFRTLLVFFGALFLSSMFSSLIHLFVLGDNIGGLGASGALMGLVSTAILLDPFYLSYELLIPLPVMVIGWLTIYADIVGIISPAQDGIGHFAHMGGFISIGLLMFFTGVENRSKLLKGLYINLISLVIAIILYFLLV